MRRTLQELTIKDNFLFCAVMMEEENCRRVLERILGMKIAHVEISSEKCIVYHREYKGIRLDVYAQDEKNTHFNVEMQVQSKKIFKRARYYHSQIDAELLSTGVEYEELPESFVIFICDFDPIGLNKYRYTLRQTLKEDGTYEYQDGIHTIFLSTKGNNEEEVPPELVQFLKYVASDLQSSEEPSEDDLVTQLQESVRKIKVDREMRARFMLFEEMMKDEFKAGKREGKIEGKIEARFEAIFELLEEIAPVPDSLQEKISSIQDDKILTLLHKKAARCESLDEFIEYLDELLTSR